METTRIIKLAAFSLLAAGMVFSASCSSGGASETDLKKSQQDLSDQQALNQQLQQQLADAKKAPASVSPAAAPSGGLLGVKTVVPPTPAPTATPLPAGAVAPTAVPRATAPASYYDSVGPYFIYAETIATSTASKYNVASTLSCTPSGVFARAQRIVFRYDIVDTATGKRLTDRDAATTTVKVVAPNGDESVGRFSQRGGGQVPDAPFMFSSSWDIPLDFPLGAVDYKITITKGGQTFTWRPPYLTSAPLNEDTRPKVVQ
jgi:hypothetical protein